jgi:hypothetical protein
LILFDANVLLYAYHTRSASHAACREIVERSFSSPGPTALCWQTVLAFLRIGTNPRVFPRPYTRSEATTIVSSWLAQPGTVLLEPGDRYWTILGGLIEEGKVTGPLMSDAALAALAIEHGATLCTTDRDFARFGKLSTLDPTT